MAGEYVRKDVFLDFVSPDNRVLFGSYSNLSKEVHERLLEESLNIAVFLCGERCLLPPSFVTQCDILRTALKAKSELLRQSIIVLPLRENSLGDFFEKKIEEYRSVKNVYRGLFEIEGQKFVSDYSHLVRKRYAEMGNTIAQRWEAGPDESEAWLPIKGRLGASNIDFIRSMPKLLKSEGKSVTWTAMKGYLDEEARQNSFFIDQAIQYEYTKTYLDEYSAVVISRLPIKQTNLCIPIEDLSYDFIALKSSLEPVGLWGSLLTMSANELIYIRSTLGWFEYITAFSQACQTYGDTFSLKHFFSLVAREIGANVKYNNENALKISRHFQNESSFSLDTAEVFSEKLLEVALSCASNIGGVIASNAKLSNFTWLGASTRMKQIFIVHGQNHTIRDKIDIYLRDLGLSTIVMAAGAHGGRSLPEKFEEMAKCDFVVFLLTADDTLKDMSTNKVVKRARQNVILEIGYFWGNMGRKGNVAFLIENKPEVELPSDIQGIGWIPITEDLGETKNRLRVELEHAGII